MNYITVFIYLGNFMTCLAGTLIINQQSLSYQWKESLKGKKKIKINKKRNIETERERK